MALDFLPLTAGKVLTPAQWNELFDSIRNGSFFLDPNAIEGSIGGFVATIDALSARVTYLESLNARQSIREQIVLTKNQATVNLSNFPVLDSEQVSLGGVTWARTGLPVGFVGDYSISGSTLTINPEHVVNIEAGNVLVLTYQSEVF